MEQGLKKNYIIWILFSGCSLLSALLQVIAVLTVYDNSANYFKDGAVLPVFAAGFALLAAIFGTVAACKTKISTPNASPFSQKACLTPATIGFLIASILLMFFAHTTAYEWLGSVSVGFLLLAALYSFLISLPKFRNNRTTALTFIGFFAILSCIVLTAYFYFDASVEMNAPIKTLVQLGLLCATVYYTGELRYLLGRPQPRLFLTLCTWMIAFGSLSAVALPIAFCVDKLKRVDYTAGALLIFCITLTALSRLRMLLNNQAKPVTASDNPPIGEKPVDTTDANTQEGEDTK